MPTPPPQPPGRPLQTSPPASQGRKRAEIREAASAEHHRRHELARKIAEDHGGVITRMMLVDAGLTRGQIRTEVDRRAWHVAGWRTLCVTGVQPSGDGAYWRALWESGPRSVLDGPTALIVTGLKGWTEERIHVSVPHNSSVRTIEGVEHHILRDLGDKIEAGLRRTKPAVAAIRAAQWARTDRQAATLLAMTIQQRLTSPASLLDRWLQVRHTNRRAFLDAVIGDVCDGAHSLGELDFSRLCRQRGLPKPSRQVVRTGPNGRVYLDAHWDDLGVHIEIQGAHHYQGTNQVDDALRFNA